MKTHGGICIGGPAAGQFYVHESFDLYIDQFDLVFIRPTDGYVPLDALEFKRTRYVFITIAVEEGGELRTGAWVLPEAAPPNRRMTPVELMMLMAADYAEKCDDVRALEGLVGRSAR